MIFNAGNLNKKIKIYRRHTTEVVDEFGFSSVKEEAPLQVSAYIIPKRGKEYMEAGVTESETEVIFIIRFREWVTEECIVEYQNVKYEVKSVIDPYMAHKSLELYCVRRHKGEAND